MIKTYSELIRLPTFEERLRYLKLNSKIGSATFGFDRYLNQMFYTSGEWRTIRHDIIVRDNACDLGVEGYDIYEAIRVHHMNEMTIEDIESGNPDILDPEFLISTSLDTHNIIHFGYTHNSTRMRVPQERRRGDTTPWKVY